MIGQPARSPSFAPREVSTPGEIQGWARLLYRSNHIFFTLISFTAVLAVLVRWSNMRVQSLWLDEGYSLWISQFSPREIWHALKMDTSTPLYYLFLHYWSKC